VTPLFAYGTFCHPRWRVRLLGLDYPARPATLAGWRRVALPSGYLSLRPSAQDRVAGVIIALDDAGWRIADAWEEVPRYVRVAVDACTGVDVLAAHTYVFTGDSETTDVDDDRFALLPDADVERAIAAFQPAMRAIRAAAPSSRQDEGDVSPTVKRPRA
jgi:hypothetical protein